VCLLFARYASGERKDSDGKTENLKQQWHVPPAIHDALAAAFSLSTERFASPLDIAASTRQYFTTCERDALFGASLDAYSCQWRGASQAHPEFNAKKLQSAVAWGVRSAHATHEPVLTVFIAPVSNSDKEIAVHEKLKKHPLVQTVTNIEKGRFAFEIAAYSGRRTFHLEEPQLNILVVANAAGVDAFIRPDKWAELQRTLSEYTQKSTGDATWDLQLVQPTARTHTGIVSTPQSFSALPVQTASRAQAMLPEPAHPALPSALRQLKYACCAIVYTDGSRLPKGAAGAGWSCRRSR
jgi:hypothetical protein